MSKGYRKISENERGAAKADLVIFIEKGLSPKQAVDQLMLSGTTISESTLRRLYREVQGKLTAQDRSLTSEEHSLVSIYGGTGKSSRKPKPKRKIAFKKAGEQASSAPVKKRSSNMASTLEDVYIQHGGRWNVRRQKTPRQPS